MTCSYFLYAYNFIETSFYLIENYPKKKLNNHKNFFHLTLNLLIVNYMYVQLGCYNEKSLANF